MKSEPEAIKKTLSKNIKKYRGFFSYTQEKLAEKAGLSSQTLNDIEGCRRWVSARTLTKIASALGICEYQLLLPENVDSDKKPRFSSLKSLVSLQKKLKITIDQHFEDAIATGNFKH